METDPCRENELTEPESDATPTKSRRLLWTVVVVLPVAAALLWGSSAMYWVGQRYRTPFSGETTSGATGSMLRPELVPLALATLAAIAAVLATGGWLRRLIGLLIVAEGGLLIWRTVDWHVGGWFAYLPDQVPPGSIPTGPFGANPAGPLLMSIAGAALVVAGLLVMLRTHRMPTMGARYSAPGARRVSPDPDKRMWDALDGGEDPTDDRRR
jgi:hypothetical protein